MRNIPKYEDMPEGFWRKGGIEHFSIFDYQILASRTLIDKPDFQITDEQVMILWNASGLAGETGELMDKIKKAIFHQQGMDMLHDDKTKAELGDICWYIAALCTHLGFSMADVMAYNVEKLRRRFPDGYKPEDTLIRRDES